MLLITARTNKFWFLENAIYLAFATNAHECRIHGIWQIGNGNVVSGFLKFFKWKKFRILLPIGKIVEIEHSVNLHLHDRIPLPACLIARRRPWSRAMVATALEFLTN